MQQVITNAMIPLDKLHPHDRNYNQHPPEQIQKIAQSLREFGQPRSIVVKQSTDGYTIIAGHGVTEAARSEGWEALRADILPADYSNEKALAYLVADNELSNGSDPDMAALAQLLEESKHAGITLEAMGFSDTALDTLLKDLADEALANGQRDADDPDGGGDDFDATPDEAQTRVQRGDIWQCGDGYRIGCFDATDIDAVRALIDGAMPSLVYTDPPYGVKVVKDNMVGADFGIAKKGKYLPIVGDETTDTALAAYHLCKSLGIDKMIFWGGNYYANELPASSCWLIWDKRGDSGIENTFADCEIAWTNMSGPSRIYRQLWNGMIREGEHDKRFHPTQNLPPLHLGV